MKKYFTDDVRVPLHESSVKLRQNEIYIKLEGRKKIKTTNFWTSLHHLEKTYKVFNLSFILTVCM